MAEHAAVIGVGQTNFDARRIDVSQVGLIREAAERALEDAECDWKDIDAVVIGKAPDMFEGVMMPELFLAEALGAVGSPCCASTPRAAWEAALASWQRASSRPASTSAS